MQLSTLSFTGVYLENKSAIITFNILSHVGIFNVVMITNTVVILSSILFVSQKLPNVRRSTMLRLAVTDTLNENKIIKKLPIKRRQSQLYTFYVLHAATCFDLH